MFFIEIEVLLCEEHRYVFVGFFVMNSAKKHEKVFTAYLSTEMRYCLQTFVFLNLNLPLDRPYTCSEDGGL